MNRKKLLNQLNQAWEAFQESYAGLSETELTQSMVTDEWSVKDIVAHITTWEAEALKHLPLILNGGRPPRYSVKYGGIDTFNAGMTEQKRALPLSAILKEFEETHQRLIDYICNAPEEQLTKETRFRRRLRLDTYSHYPKHTRAILRWRDRSARGSSKEEKAAKPQRALRPQPRRIED